MPDLDVTALRGPRVPRESVWCCRSPDCDGIGVPGWEGGGHAMLCTPCERLRLEAARVQAEIRGRAAVAVPVS